MYHIDIAEEIKRENQVPPFFFSFTFLSTKSWLWSCDETVHCTGAAASGSTWPCTLQNACSLCMRFAHGVQSSQQLLQAYGRPHCRAHGRAHCRAHWRAHSRAHCRTHWGAHCRAHSRTHSGHIAGHTAEHTNHFLLPPLPLSSHSFSLSLLCLSLPTPSFCSFFPCSPPSPNSLFSFFLPFSPSFSLFLLSLFPSPFFFPSLHPSFFLPS